MTAPRQGEVWWAQAEDKRRPVLVVTREDVVPALRRVVVAPVTRTVRGIPTEIPLGPDDGLDVACVASFDNLQPISIALLTERVGAATPGANVRICGALRALADC